MKKVEINIEAHVNYITALPMQGRLEFVLTYPEKSNVIDEKSIDSQDLNAQDLNAQDILNIITPYILEELGSSDDNWIISIEPRIRLREYVYSFIWKELYNNILDIPIIRTKTFREYRDRIIIPMT